jgi:hypothetical protein
MTAPLRNLLGQLADHDARASATTAPDFRTEALQMRTEISRHRTRRITAVTAAAAAVVAVVAVGIMTANAVTAPPALAPAVPEPSTTATASPTVGTTASPAPTVSVSAPSMTPTEPSPAVTTPAVIETPPQARPQQADITHGNDVWGTYVAVVDSSISPTAEAAKARISELGYEPSGGDVGCDGGAAEALGLPNDVQVIATYFSTKEDAALFAQMYGPDTLGIAEVTLYCLD